MLCIDRKPVFDKILLVVRDLLFIIEIIACLFIAFDLIPNKMYIVSGFLLQVYATRYS